MSNHKENISLVRIGDELVRFSDISQCIRKFKNVDRWDVTCYRIGKNEIGKSFYGDRANSRSDEFMEELVQLSKDNN